MTHYSPRITYGGFKIASGPQSYRYCQSKRQEVSMGVQFPGPPVVPVYPDPMRQGQPRRDPSNRLNLGPGMKVLIVGPEPAEFVKEAVERVESDGQVIVVTGEQEEADRLQATWQKAGAAQVSVHVGPPHELPVPDDSLDRAVAARVLGTSSVDRQRVLQELHRVLKPGALLGVEQRMMDRGSVGPRTVKQWCAAAGFERIRQYGSPLHYMLIFWLKPETSGEGEGSQS
jgi:SAM-dependent methyltransferase